VGAAFGDEVRGRLAEGVAQVAVVVAVGALDRGTMKLRLTSLTGKILHRESCPPLQCQPFGRRPTAQEAWYGSALPPHVDERLEMPEAGRPYRPS